MRGMKAVPVIQKTQIKKKPKHINKLLQKFTAKFPKCISGKLVMAALPLPNHSAISKRKEKETRDWKEKKSCA